MFQSRPDQMVIDFDRPQAMERPTRVDAVRSSGKAVFHPESSNFEASRFGLKFSYRGGTYLVRGTIRTYRNGGYIPSRLNKQEEVELTRATYAAVKDPYTNPFITVAHARNSFV